MAQIKEFVNLELMQTVRNMHLNPLIRRVENEIGPALTLLEDEMQYTFKDVTLDVPSKTLTFERSIGGGAKQIELAPIMPTFAGIGVENEAGIGPGSDITVVRFKDSTVTRSNNIANVVYDWPKIVGDNVIPLQVGDIGGPQKATKYLFFKGGKVVHTAPDITTIDVSTPSVPLLASIPNKPDSDLKPITQIVLEGDVESSSIANEILTININSGSITPLSQGHFKGFFESLGDIESQIKDPVDGKSFAFAKDMLLGGKFYTPYFYVNGAWKELKQDPALTYSHPSEVDNHGVFSIKPNDKITVDANGQLNLDELGAAPDPKYFHGFFQTYKDLTDDVTAPVPEKSLAYVKHPNGGWIGYRATSQGSASKWDVFAPIAGFSLVDSKTSVNVPATAYGIYKDDQWEIDAKGLLTLKAMESSLDIAIGGTESEPVTGHIKAIQFMAGKSYATLQNDKLFLNHPQRVINYDGEFEQDHNSRDYEGNIFYDETSRCWMGWGIPDAPGAVDKKWTRIAHPKMSDEVKGLGARLPAKAPTVSGGTLGDDAKWEHTGWTYVEPVGEHDASDLPDAIKQSGAYVQTYVKNVDGEGGIPQHRMQTCYEDAETGSQWIRMFDATPANPGDPVWKKWVRTSYSPSDMESHMADPAAHKDVIKQYRVFALTGKMQSIFAQTTGDALGGLHADNSFLLADNYGYTGILEQDYLDVPTAGKYRVSGVLSFSGYKEGNSNYPVTAWQVLIRKKTKGGTGWGPVGQFRYVHTDGKKPYPTIIFLVDEIQLEDHEELIFNITCDQTLALKNNHPDLYLAPSRCNVVVEHHETKAGTGIARSFRRLFGNLDTIGDVGIKSHYNNIAAGTGNIRVYGEVVQKIPTEMQRIS